MELGQSCPLTCLVLGGVVASVGGTGGFGIISICGFINSCQSDTGTDLVLYCVVRGGRVFLDGWSAAAAGK